jgi:ammonia channel protein AmtB
MLSSLYSVTMVTAAMAVLCALMETMIPQGKLKSTVLLALGIVFLLALASPLAGLLQEPPTLAAGAMQDTFALEQQTTHYEDLLRGYYEISVAGKQ